MEQEIEDSDRIKARIYIFSCYRLYGSLPKARGEVGEIPALSRNCDAQIELSQVDRDNQNSLCPRGRNRELHF